MTLRRRKGRRESAQPRALAFYRKQRITDQLGFYTSRQDQFERATGQALAISATLLGFATATRSPARLWGGPRCGRPWRLSCPRYPQRSRLTSRCTPSSSSPRSTVTLRGPFRSLPVPRQTPVVTETRARLMRTSPSLCDGWRRRCVRSKLSGGSSHPRFRYPTRPRSEQNGGRA